MRRGLIDRYSGINSPIHRLDPRAKVLGFSIAVLVIASTPRDDLSRFGYYYALIAVLVLLSRIPLNHLVRRCLAASPFIVMAACLPYLSLWLDPAFLVVESASSFETMGDYARRLSLSVLLKAYGAIVLLTLLTATSRLHGLLWALRKLKAPEVLHVIATLMHRYIFILFEEWQRATRARALRSPAGLRISRLSIYGKQIGLVFLRGWERAERVQAAMVSRGFTGAMPLAEASRFELGDAAFVTVSVACFLAVRVQWL